MMARRKETRPTLLRPGIKAYCRKCGWTAGVLATRCIGCGVRYPSVRPRFFAQLVLGLAVLAAVAAVAVRVARYA